MSNHHIHFSFWLPSVEFWQYLTPFSHVTVFKVFIWPSTMDPSLHLIAIFPREPIITRMMIMMIFFILVPILSQKVCQVKVKLVLIMTMLLLGMVSHKLHAIVLTNDIISCISVGWTVYGKYPPEKTSSFQQTTVDLRSQCLGRRCPVKNKNSHDIRLLVLQRFIYIGLFQLSENGQQIVTAS